jgi:hypothetical protein
MIEGAAVPEMNCYYHFARVDSAPFAQRSLWMFSSRVSMQQFPIIVQSHQ